MVYGSDMVVYILRAASLDRSRANQGEGCGGGGQVGERANGDDTCFQNVDNFYSHAGELPKRR
jgi:hypothetical protein